LEPKVILIIILIALAVLIMVQNLQPVQFNILFFKVQMSQIVLVAISILIGFGIGFFVARRS
jgi:uncharacterized integral membrane protein